MAQLPMLSYAQNGEDVVLNRAFGHQSSGFYIDIGPCHPVDGSVTFHFYKRGWCGVNVEPDRVLFMAFVKDRPRDININVAVGGNRGHITFKPTATSGHGTLDTALAPESNNGRSPEGVPLCTLSDVIGCYSPSDGKIDFLKIDVEGREAEVIASGDWLRHRPRVLVIEAINDLGDATYGAWEPTLLDAGYRYAMFDGLNRFYCRNEDADELMSRLEAPANARDDWARASDNTAHETITRLNAELAAAFQERAAAHARAEALASGFEAALAETLAEAGAAATRLEAAEERCGDLAAQLEQLRADLASATALGEALKVAVSRAKSEAATALAREEAAEASLVALEAEAARLRLSTAAALRHAEQVAALKGELSKRNAKG